MDTQKHGNKEKLSVNHFSCFVSLYTCKLKKACKKSKLMQKSRLHCIAMNADHCKITLVKLYRTCIRDCLVYMYYTVRIIYINEREYKEIE